MRTQQRRLAPYVSIGLGTVILVAGWSQLQACKGMIPAPYRVGTFVEARQATHTESIDWRIVGDNDPVQSKGVWGVGANCDDARTTLGKRVAEWIGIAEAVISISDHLNQLLNKFQTSQILKIKGTVNRFSSSKHAHFMKVEQIFKALHALIGINAVSVDQVPAFE